MHQLTPNANAAILDTLNLILSGSTDLLPVTPQTSTLHYLLRTIACYAQMKEGMFVNEPRCRQMVKHPEYAVQHFQVIRDDLQDALRKGDFSDVLNSGEFALFVLHQNAHVSKCTDDALKGYINRDLGKGIRAIWSSSSYAWHTP